MIKELRPESLLDDDDPDDDHATVVLSHPMTKSGTPPAGDERAMRRVTSFGAPQGANRAIVGAEEQNASLYERLLRAGALDEVMSIAAEATFDARVPLTQATEAVTPSSPPFSAVMADLADELEPHRDSAEQLRESDLDILDDGAFISVRPESSPISYHSEHSSPMSAPRPLGPPALSRGRVPSVMLGPGASTRTDATERLAAIPSTHPLANTLIPIANTVPPIRTTARHTPWWQVAIAAAALIGLGVALGRMQQQLDVAPKSLAQNSGEQAPSAADEARLAPPASAAVVAEPASIESQTRDPSLRDSVATPKTVEPALASRVAASPRSTRDPSGAPNRPSELANLPNARAMVAPVTAPPVPQEIAGSNLPAQPTRDAVVTALSSIERQLSACAGEKHGVANVTLTVRGAGVVSHALVTGAFAGTPEGSCIARAVKLARFEPFRDASVRITYPFQL